MSFFWVLSQTEPCSSAFEEVALEGIILLSHWFSTGDIVPPRGHQAMSRDMFASQLEWGASGI